MTSVLNSEIPIVHEPTIDDVRLCYNFFLGRDAEPDAPLSGYAAMARQDAIADLINSQEFTNSVVDAVAVGGRPASPLFQTTPAPDVLSWACRFLPLSPEGRNDLKSSRSWVEALHAVAGAAVRERVELGGRVEQDAVDAEEAALGVQHLALVAGVERSRHKDRRDTERKAQRAAREAEADQRRHAED
jgi:hypothetical protein